METVKKENYLIMRVSGDFPNSPMFERVRFIADKG